LLFVDGKVYKLVRQPGFSLYKKLILRKIGVCVCDQISWSLCMEFVVLISVGLMFGFIASDGSWLADLRRRLGKSQPAYARRHVYELTPEQKLLLALYSSDAQERLEGIRAIARRNEGTFAFALAECALAHAYETGHNLEIVRILSDLPESPEKRRALRLLRAHSSAHVRAALPVWVFAA
jgi:hypothetical protein